MESLAARFPIIVSGLNSKSLLDQTSSSLDSCSSSKSMPATTGPTDTTESKEKSDLLKQRPGAKGSSSAGTGTTRQRLSVERRFDIIAKLEQGVPRRQVMKDFNLKHSSNITTILKRKESIIGAMAKGTKARAKAIRSSKFPMIDRDLRHFVDTANQAGRFVSRHQLTERALIVAQKHAVLFRFKASKGYIDKFFQQQNVRRAIGPTVTAAAPLSTATSPMLLDPKQSTVNKSPAVGSQESAPVSPALVSPTGPQLPTTRPDLRQELVRKLNCFTQEHVAKVQAHVNNVIEASVRRNDAHVSQLVSFRCELMDHLSRFGQSTLTTLQDLMHLHVNRFIDLSENLMYRLISLTEHLLSRFSRLAHDVRSHVRPEVQTMALVTSDHHKDK